jgi:hypothetical protein
MNNVRRNQPGQASKENDTEIREPKYIVQNTTYCRLMGKRHMGKAFLLSALHGDD